MLAKHLPAHETDSWADDLDAALKTQGDVTEA